jgi:DHA1 family bicyclomycin/chloramphenicol resistance-like MFS transporter
MRASFIKTAVILGLVTAVGPFAIDMYLPALPAIAEGLGTGIAGVQTSLTAFFLSFGLFQAIYGPVSDVIGRKAPLYFGLGLFVAGSIGCALAPNIETLILFRFIQGIGASAGMVLPLSIVRDLHTGAEATRLMSLIMLVFSVSPILAPLFGSIVVEAFGWRAIFVAISAAGLASLAVVGFGLKETRPPEERIESGIGVVATNYLALLRDGKFLGLTFIGGLGMGSFFAFLASSSFVYIEHFGVTPTVFSMLFSVNAIAFIGVAQSAGFFIERFGLDSVVRTAVAGYVVMALLLFGLTVAGVDSLPVIVVSLFVGFGFLGLVIPSTAVLALEDYGPTAGTAAALMGTLRFAAGAVAIALASAFFDGTPLPMITMIAACAVGAFVLSRVTLSGRTAAEPKEAAAAAEEAAPAE